MKQIFKPAFWLTSAEMFKLFIGRKVKCWTCHATYKIEAKDKKKLHVQLCFITTNKRSVRLSGECPNCKDTLDFCLPVKAP